MYFDGLQRDAGRVEVAQQAGHGLAGARHPAADVVARGPRRPRRSSRACSAATRTRSSSATSRSTRSPATCDLRLSGCRCAGTVGTARNRALHAGSAGGDRAGGIGRAAERASGTPAQQRAVLLPVGVHLPPRVVGGRGPAPVLAGGELESPALMSSIVSRSHASSVTAMSIQSTHARRAWGGPFSGRSFSRTNASTSRSSATRRRELTGGFAAPGSTVGPWQNSLPALELRTAAAALPADDQTRPRTPRRRPGRRHHAGRPDLGAEARRRVVRRPGGRAPGRRAVAAPAPVPDYEPVGFGDGPPILDPSVPFRVHTADGEPVDGRERSTASGSATPTWRAT